MASCHVMMSGANLSNLEKCRAMNCFSTYFTHAQTCVNVPVPSASPWTASMHDLHMSKPSDNTRVHSAAQWTASAHTLPMSKPVITPVLKALRNGLLRHIYFTHAQTCVMTFVFKVLCYTYFTHSQTCDNVRGQGATQWTASAHALHIPKPVITFMVNVLRNGLLRYKPYTCPNL